MNKSYYCPYCRTVKMRYKSTSFGMQDVIYLLTKKIMKNDKSITRQSAIQETHEIIHDIRREARAEKDIEK